MTPAPKRRWFQWSLRTLFRSRDLLLIAMVVVAIGLLMLAAVAGVVWAAAPDGNEDAQNGPRAEERAPLRLDGLKPMPEPIRVTLKLDRTEFLLGESIAVDYEMTNVGKQLAPFDPGAFYPDSRVNDGFRMSAVRVDENGKPLDAPVANWPAPESGGGKGTNLTLTPGESRSTTLFVTRVIRFTSPGRYRLRIENVHRGTTAVYSSGETLLTLNEPTPQQAHTVFSRMKLAPREAYDDQKMAFLKDAADFETMHQAFYLPVLSKALENGDLDALPSLERIERLEASEVIVAAVARALDRDDWQTARACYQRVKQSLPFPNWYDDPKSPYDESHRGRVARTWRPDFGAVLTRLAKRLATEVMTQMQARAKRPKEADANDPEFLDWFRRGMFPKDHPQSLLLDISFIYSCVGRSEDFADCMSAYEKSIELTKTLPLETNQYFRPRGSASGFRHAVFRMLKRGAKAPTDPAHPGEAATFAIALRTQPNFRPEGWQAQVMKWLRHDSPYLAEVILDNLPEPIPDQVLEYLPTALAQDYIDLQIAACHFAEKHPRPIYQEPLKAIVETATDKYLRKFAVDAARANGLEAQYDKDAPFVEQAAAPADKTEKTAPAPQDRAEASPATRSATLTGRFVYDGTPPEPRDLKIPIRRQYLTPEGQREGKVVEAWQRAAEAGVPDETETDFLASSRSRVAERPSNSMKS